MHGFLLAHLLNSWLETCLSLCQPALFEALTVISSWDEMMCISEWPIWSPRRRKHFPCLEPMCSDSFPLLIQVSQDSNYKGTGNHTVKTTTSYVVWFAVPIPSVGAAINLLPLLLLCLSLPTSRSTGHFGTGPALPRAACSIAHSLSFALNIRIQQHHANFMQSSICKSDIFAQASPSCAKLKINTL